MNIFFNGRGYSDAASLDNAETGAWRYTSLAASNSPSGSDTEGILLVFNVIRNDGVNPVNTQIFIGYQTNTVYMRMCWYGNNRSWIKLG